MAEQLSVFLQNESGKIASVASLLAAGGIDIRALSLTETEGFGIVRIIVDDVLETTSVLKQEGYVCRLTPVVIAEIPDEPGGLNRVLTIFHDNQINVEYMYATLGGGAKRALMIFRVDNDKRAERELREKHIQLIEQSDIAEL